MDAPSHYTDHCWSLKNMVQVWRNWAFVINPLISQDISQNPLDVPTPSSPNPMDQMVSTENYEFDAL